MDCIICREEVNSVRKLSCHLRFAHQLTSHQYYDQYVKKAGDDKCIECGNKTQFKNIVLGYNQTCSRYCCNISLTRINKIIETKDQKYGDGWSAIYQKQQSTVNSWSPDRKKEYRKNLSNALLNANLNDPTIRDRAKRTLKIKYSDKEWSDICRNGHSTRTQAQIKEANQKRKATELLRYGVESHTQTEKYRKLVKYNNETRSLNKRKEIIEKTIKTKINKGYYLPVDHPDRKSKKDYKNKVRRLSDSWANIKFSKEELRMRGLNGIPNAVQLDHIVSLETCYQQKIPVEIAGHCVNLRLIPWQDNINKYSGNHMTVQELNEAFKNYNETKHLI